MSRVFLGPAPRMRVQMENKDGTWTELAIDNGLSLEVQHPDPYKLGEGLNVYVAKFEVEVPYQTWHDLLWDLSKREVREKNAGSGNT